MFAEHHARDVTNGHQILAWEQDGSLVGVVYFVPKEFADGVWEIMMIAVDSVFQRQGIGSNLLLEVEKLTRAAHGRLLLIKTSSKSSFERTRQFYRKHDYKEVAHIPDFFSDGDGKASFVKRL
jgi:ribosomal protein S18 acetylase RimI-like enzyme